MTGDMQVHDERHRHIHFQIHNKLFFVFPEIQKRKIALLEPLAIAVFVQIGYAYDEINALFGLVAQEALVGRVHVHCASLDRKRPIHEGD